MKWGNFIFGRSDFGVVSRILVVCLNLSLDDDFKILRTPSEGKEKLLCLVRPPILFSTTDKDWARQPPARPAFRGETTSSSNPKRRKRKFLVHRWSSDSHSNGLPFLSFQILSFFYRFVRLACQMDGPTDAFSTSLQHGSAVKALQRVFTNNFGDFCMISYL